VRFFPAKPFLPAATAPCTKYPPPITRMSPRYCCLGLRRPKPHTTRTVSTASCSMPPHSLDMPCQGLDRRQSDLQHHYEVHAWRRVHLEKMLVAQTANKSTASYETCAVLSTGRLSPVTCSRTIQSYTLRYATVFHIILLYQPQSFK